MERSKTWSEERMNRFLRWLNNSDEANMIRKVHYFRWLSIAFVPNDIRIGIVYYYWVPPSSTGRTDSHEVVFNIPFIQFSLHRDYGR